jgi:hypothetical protein
LSSFAIEPGPGLPLTFNAPCIVEVLNQNGCARHRDASPATIFGSIAACGTALRPIAGLTPKGKFPRFQLRFVGCERFATDLSRAADG